MKTLTCPIPTNINPLQNNGFLFNIIKLPEIQFFCQEVNLPDVTLPPAIFNNPFVKVPVPGDKIEFGDLQVTFMINENMDNYVAIYNWIIGLGFPESNDQYKNFINDRTDFLSSNESNAASSDAILQILGSNNQPVKTVQFIDVIPVSLISLQLQTITQDTTYLAGQATFNYTSFKIT